MVLRPDPAQGNGRSHSPHPDPATALQTNHSHTPETVNTGNEQEFAPRWYAARVRSQRKGIREYLAARAIRSYEVSLIPSLLFVQCTEAELTQLSTEFERSIWFYRDTERKAPAAISDREMASFVIVTSAGSADIIALDISDPGFLQGDRVRVKDGPFKGAEGIIKRIKGDRRLIVEVHGVAVVATSFIHPGLLERVEE